MFNSIMFGYLLDFKGKQNFILQYSKVILPISSISKH